jgi:hypothetical protein
MNKSKKMAIVKHRRKRKKMEERRKALALLSGGANKTALKTAVKKEIEIPQPVKALADMLKPKKAAAAKKPVAKKEKTEGCDGQKGRKAQESSGGQEAGCQKGKDRAGEGCGT